MEPIFQLKKLKDSEEVNDAFYQIDTDFMDDFMNLVKKDECCIPHDALYKYGTLVLFGILIISTLSKNNFIPILPLIQFLGEGFLRLLGFS